MKAVRTLAVCVCVKHLEKEHDASQLDPGSCMVVNTHGTRGLGETGRSMTGSAKKHTRRMGRCGSGNSHGGETHGTRALGETGGSIKSSVIKKTHGEWGGAAVDTGMVQDTER